VSLADGSTVLSCSGVVKLSYSIANVSMQHTFFVANIGVQSMILGMPFLEKENPDIDWIAKSLTWRTKSPLPLPPPPSLTSPLPALSPTPSPLLPTPHLPSLSPTRRAPRAKSPYRRDTRRSSRSKPRSKSRSQTRSSSTSVAEDAPTAKTSPVTPFISDIPDSDDGTAPGPAPSSEIPPTSSPPVPLSAPPKGKRRLPAILPTMRVALS
jgi:hypothetical protein